MPPEELEENLVEMIFGIRHSRPTLEVIVRLCEP